MVVLTANVKESFVDLPAIQREMELAIGPGRMRSYNRAGALVRSIARRSIKRRKGRLVNGKRVFTPSPAGSAPYSRDPQGTYKRILFAWDSQLKMVIVGHVGYQSRNQDTVPATHEFGESVTLTKVVFPKTAAKRRLTDRQRRAFAHLLATKDIGPRIQRYLQTRNRPQKQETRVSVKMPKRPTMGPALERSKEQLPDFWGDAPF